MFIALAIAFVRVGKWFQLCFVASVSGPALSPVVRGFFFGRPTVTATKDRPRLGQPMTHSSFSWLLGPLGGPPVVVLCTPQMGSLQASSNKRTGRTENRPACLFCATR